MIVLFCDFWRAVSNVDAVEIYVLMSGDVSEVMVKVSVAGLISTDIHYHVEDCGVFSHIVIFDGFLGSWLAAPVLNVTAFDLHLLY